MNECSLGGITENDLLDMTVSMGYCLCDASCEPHRHFDWHPIFIECMHDGTTDHRHCPQAPSYQENIDDD